MCHNLLLSYSRKGIDEGSTFFFLCITLLFFGMSDPGFIPVKKESEKKLGKEYPIREKNENQRGRTISSPQKGKANETIHHKNSER
jgi:hypothetical protein